MGKLFAEPLSARGCALDGCDEIFVPARLYQLCCSEKHGKKHYNRVSRADGRQPNPVWDDRRRANWQRRRALGKGASSAETFAAIEVFERDGWVCGICEEPVDRVLVWPDPMSSSLDHIIPVSLGGEHTRANAQLAHLICNTRKGAKLEMVSA